MKQLNISGYKKIALGFSLVIIAACGKDEVQIPDYPAVKYYVSAQNMSIRQVSYTVSGNKTVHLSLATPEHKVSPFSFDTTVSRYISITANGIADSTGFGIINVGIIVNNDTVARSNASGELASTSANFTIK